MDIACFLVMYIGDGCVTVPQWLLISFLTCSQEMGLPVGAHIPMLGFIGRLDYQKGVDLIRDNHGWMMGEGVQLILLGSGREDLEQSLR